MKSASGLHSKTVRSRNHPGVQDISSQPGSWKNTSLIAYRRGTGEERELLPGPFYPEALDEKM